MVPRGGVAALKTFVRSIDSEQKAPNPEQASSVAPSGFLCGADARQAYEDIVSSRYDVPSSNEKCRARVLAESCQEESEFTTEPAPQNLVLKSKTQLRPQRGNFNPTLSSLMRHAEQNDCEKVMDVINLNNSLLNAVDQFGWSPLMVAACAGALKVVELLLQCGADTKLRDRGGQTCVSLARKQGHRLIIEAIKNYRPHVPERPERKSSAFPKCQLCNLCNVSIEESSKRSHLTSTVHQLSQCTKGCKTYYAIPGSNRGFQIMLKSGWDGEKGLGPSGSGTKYPPKTTLKRDRKGLGVSKQRARITHFQSNDLKAIARDSCNSSSSKEHKNKAQLNQQIQQEKFKERSLRWQLN